MRRSTCHNIMQPKITLLCLNNGPLGQVAPLALSILCQMMLCLALLYKGSNLLTQPSALIRTILIS